MYYEAYGDDSLIREYYPNMLACVDYLGTRADGNLIDFGLGDWYDYGDFVQASRATRLSDLSHRLIITWIFSTS